MTPIADKDPELARRAAVKRTAWAFAVIAIVVYAAFLYTGMRG
jgi:hypothetical protein